MKEYVTLHIILSTTLLHHNNIIFDFHCIEVINILNVGKINYYELWRAIMQSISHSNWFINQNIVDYWESWPYNNVQIIHFKIDNFNQFNMLLRAFGNIIYESIFLFSWFNYLILYMICTLLIIYIWWCWI